VSAQDEQRLRETLAAAIQPAFDEWLFRMHGVVSSCGHETEAAGIAAALLPVILADREKAVQQARAEAWDEGYDAGVGDESFSSRGLSTDPDADEFPHDNPYREAQP
jgi:hypothetical protein